MSELATERLISVDSHVHFTDEWVKGRLRKEMQVVWDEANKKAEEYAAKVLRGGQPQLELEDFVDPEAAMDPATSSRTPSSRRWTATASTPK